MMLYATMTYSLPRIDELIDLLQDARWFTTLDLESEYWQIKVQEEDQEKTAFITKFGTYEFRVMPFGLCNAPVTFQQTGCFSVSYRGLLIV